MSIEVPNIVDHLQHVTEMNSHEYQLNYPWQIDSTIDLQENQGGEGITQN